MALETPRREPGPLGQGDVPSALSPTLSSPPGWSHLQRLSSPSWVLSPADREVGDAIASLVPFRALCYLVLQPYLLKPSWPLPNPHEVSLPRSKTKGGGHRYLAPALPHHSISHLMGEGRGVDLLAVGAGAGCRHFLSWA